MHRAQLSYYVAKCIYACIGPSAYCEQKTFADMYRIVFGAQHRALMMSLN